MSLSFYLAQATPPPPPDVPPAAPPAPPAAPPPAPDGLFDQLLAFIYTLAHWLGWLIVQGLNQILPLPASETLTDPIGFLALLTLFLVVAEIAKKIAWIIVVVGWVLIVIRIALEVMQQPQGI